eukprot:5747_1
MSILKEQKNSSFMVVGAIEIAYGFIAILTLFVLSPLCIYWTYVFYGHKDELFVQKRNVKMTIGLNIGLLLYIVFLGLFAISSLFDALYVAFTASIVLFIGLWMFAYCLICKTWMIYYDYKFIFYSLDSEWTTIIDSTSHSKNWYLKHRKTFGNARWIMKTLAPVFILFFVCQYLSLVGMIFTGNPVLAITGVLTFMLPVALSMIAYIIILRKTPNAQKFNDMFYIHWESKLYAKLMLIYFIITFISFGLFALFLFIAPNVYRWMQQVAWLFWSLATAFGVYSSTKRIVNKNKAREAQLLPIQSAVSSSVKAIATSSRECLIEILSNQETVHLFMIHLSLEYSMELLLSFIEFSQFLDYLEGLQRVGKNKDSSFKHDMASLSKGGLDLFVFADSLPASSIVTKKENGHDFKQKAYELYCKYIRTGTEYEINVSATIRNEFRGVMDKYEMLKIMDTSMSELKRLFMECREHMLLAIGYSLSRFTKTDEYEKVVQIVSAYNSE